MIWDAFLVSALAAELDTRLGGVRLKGHSFRWEERELSLHFRSGTLRWFLHPRKGWFTFHPPGELPADFRPLAAEVTRITSRPDERILEIHLQRPRGRARFHRVMVELMTNQWNALLLEGSQGWIRHLLWTRHLEERNLVVGRPYLPPAPSRREGIQEPLTVDRWQGLLAGQTREEAEKTLLDRVAFTSPINLPYLLEGSPESWATSQGAAAALRRWKALRNHQFPDPCILEIGRDRQPYPIVINSFDHIVFTDIISAIQAVPDPGSSAGDTHGEDAREAVQRAIHGARGRVMGIRREMEEAEDPEEPRMMANLLLARLAEVPRGEDSVVLLDFHGEETEIPLDPSLPPQDNAERMYQEAARRERARDRLPGLLRDAEEALRRLEELGEDLEEGTLSPEEVHSRLPASSRKKKPGSRLEERLPYHSFTSSGGLEIRVGRGSRDNDDLTFRHSRPEDVWLHARDSAGAHVILRWDREGNPPRRDLAEAAILAALNSGARNAGTVPVDWTRRKYVRKPRKAPPGSVVPREVETLFVEPDPRLPQRLRSSRPGHS